MSKYLPQLDFVRSVAVLLVFAGHLIHTLGYDHIFGTMAHFGVELFFIHTALVLFLSLERNRAGFANFYVRRVFRIYPLSAMTVALMVLLHIPATSWGAIYSFPGWGALTANLALVQNITGHKSVVTVLWSLPLEVQMYALLPILFAAYHRKLSAYCIWLLAAGLAFASLSLPADRNFFLYAPCFCSGIVAYHEMKQNSARIRFRTLALSLAGLIALNQVVARTSLSLAATHSVLCLAAGVLIGRAGAPAWGKLRTVSATMAKYSYGMYLSHVPLMWLCFRHARGFAETAIFAGAAVAVPLAMYHWIEAPMIRLGAELTESRKLRGVRLRQPQSASA